MLRTCCLAALLGTLPAVMHAAGTPDYDTLQQNDTRRISGRVTDDTGKPLMGVTVVEKGTTNGVSTTADGSYTLRLQNAENAVLEFSFIGYRNTELPAGTKTTLDVQLTESVTTMDNVVVIGYGTTTKKELTGSVSSLKSDDFKQGNITNPLQLLQGQVAGLNIVRADGGDPNGDFEIQLRGMTTMAGGASPLVVIDGVVGGDLSNVSPDDIASIDVLKDGSAAAIYGTRGTNGVILVTTKKAHAGENRIEFSAYVAMQSVDKKPDVMSASEYRNTIRQYFPDKASSYDFGGSTDWFDAVTAFETVYFWPDLPKSFREIRRVLRPGGTLLICNECSGDAPGDEAWTKKIAGMRIYPAAELQRLLEQAGFRRIQIHKTSRWLCLTAQKPD